MTTATAEITITAENEPLTYGIELDAKRCDMCGDPLNYDPLRRNTAVSHNFAGDWIVGSPELQLCRPCYAVRPDSLRGRHSRKPKGPRPHIGPTCWAGHPLRLPGDTCLQCVADDKAIRAELREIDRLEDAAVRSHDWRLVGPTRGTMAGDSHYASCVCRDCGAGRVFHFNSRTGGEIKVNPISREDIYPVCSGAAA